MHPSQKLSFSMNTSMSLKSFNVILCESKYSRLSFFGTFLFTNLPAFNNAAIDTDLEKTDGGAAACLASVTFEIIVPGTGKLPGVDEINLSGEATVCSLFSKNLTKNTFFPFIYSK